MAIQSRNLSPNVCGKDTKPPVVAVMGLLIDIPKVASHYFGELVAIKKTGRKVSLPNTRNELARVIGRGNTPYNGAFFLSP